MHVEHDKAAGAPDRIYLSDIRRMRYCHGGVRRWAAARGIDWNDFVKNGIEAARLEGIDDAMCRRLLKAVRHG